MASEWDMDVLGVRAIAFTQLGQLAKARALLDRSRSLLGYAPGQISPFWTDLAERHWLVASDRAGEALTAFRASEAAHPLTSGAQETVDALTNAAWLTLEAGDAAAAQAQASQTLVAIAAGGLADYKRDFEARAMLVLGRALLRQRRASEALPVLEKAVEMHRAVYDPDHSPAVAKAWLALAEARRALGDPRAADAQKQARRILTESAARS